MLNSDQRIRLKLLLSLGNFSKKDAIKALEDNEWDTSLAFDWLKAKEANPDLLLDDFHREYEEKKKSAAVMPQDRYDLEPSKSAPVSSNRASRRAKKKKK